MVFGWSVHPLRYGLGLEVGTGRVVPELKYWPSRSADEAGRIVEEFASITRDALERAADLGTEALQLETELSHTATLNPKIAREIVEAQKEIVERYHSEYGIALALRVTVADIRWSREVGRREALARMLETFEQAAEAGADVLSIESIGGKEVFDYSIMRGDLKGIALALGVLAPADVAKLWREISSIAAKRKVLAGGDSACGFANTAMKLAGGFKSRMLPHTLAALVRAMSAPRTLKAFEEGAVGPGKDCAYENVIVKAADPQALVLAPPSAWEIAKTIIAERDDYRRMLAAGRKALELIETEWKAGYLVLDGREAAYLQRLKRELDTLPDSAESMLELAPNYEEKAKFKLSDYLG
jgi:methanol--5-hydroxybenzimidazolylcobamide Co-methyltransferase